MIEYAQRLFLTDKTRKNLEKIKENIENGEHMLLTGLYVIELAMNRDDVFDLIPVRMFKLKSFRNRDHYIIGFAESRSACYSLVTEIVTEHYDVTKRHDGLRADIEKVAFRLDPDAGSFIRLP